MSEPPATNVHNPLVLLVAGSVLLVSMWAANQGGLEAVAPGKFAASLVILLESLPTVAAMWVAAAGLGYPLRRWLLPEVRFGAIAQLGLGMAALLMLNWALAWAGLLNGVTGWGLCGVGAAALIAQLVIHRKAIESATGKPVRLPWTLPLVMPGLGLLLVAVTCPPGTLWSVEAFGYDVLSYHLQLPREWLELGAMRGLEHNVYSYLPSLVEAAYMQLGAMHGSVHEAVYTCQLFHASLAVLAAAAVAYAAATFVEATAATLAAAVWLAVPWVLITGSLAYDEMAALALGGVALVIMFDVASQRWRGAAAVGFLVGAATLAKLTAGPMIALPVGVILLTRLNQALRWRKPREWPVGVRAAGVAAMVGLLTLSPYLVRNWTWTGNPVFPFATDLLGRGHWDEPLAARWAQGHGLATEQDEGEQASPAPPEATSGFTALRRQWLFNTGYGAVGGHPTPRETHNIARFPLEGGVPVLWIAALLAVLLTVHRIGLRRAVAALLIMVALQLAFWLVGTHRQSRFLIFTLLPAAVLVGIGAGRLAEVAQRRAGWAMPVAGLVLVPALALTSLNVFYGQTQWAVTAEGQRVRASPALIVDSLIDPATSRPGMVGDHAINRLPAWSRTYLVADTASLLYIRRPFVYHSAFDASPLGGIIRQAEGDPAAVNRLLRDAGITHVWVHWSELDRLHSTYGYDPDVTVPTLERLIASGWQRVESFGHHATLFALPREEGAGAAAE